MEEIVDAMGKRKAVKKVMRGHRCAVLLILANDQTQIRHYNSQRAAGLEYTETLAGNGQGFRPLEMFERMRGIDVADALICKGQALSDVEPVHITRPSRESQEPAQTRNATQENGWRVINVVPARRSRKTGADIDLLSAVVIQQR